MKILVNFIRNLLGYIIIAMDLITRGTKKKRDPQTQQAINQQLQNFSLYQFSACPFCTKTRRAMYKLNLPIEKRDASQDSKHRAELLEGGGRVKVPCLRIEENGQVTWMYESSDIIRYLETRFS